MRHDQYASYRRHYSDPALRKKLEKLTDSLREGVILLFLLLRDPVTPIWVKTLAIGVLGYVIFPFDLLPDPLPFGFTDDMAAVASAVLSIRQHISEDLRQRAKKQQP